MCIEVLQLILKLLLATYLLLPFYQAYLNRSTLFFTCNSQLTLLQCKVLAIMWYFFLDTVITKNDGNQKIFQRPGMEHTFGKGSPRIFYVFRSWSEIITLFYFFREYASWANYFNTRCLPATLTQRWRMHYNIHHLALQDINHDLCLD